MDWPIRKEENYVMCSFWTTNGVVLGGCARTNTLISERQNVEISVSTSWMCTCAWLNSRMYRWVGYATWQFYVKCVKGCEHKHGVRQIWGALGSRPLRRGTCLTHYKHALPTWITVPNLIECYESMYGHPSKTGLLASRLSRSVKVIRTDTDRSGTWYMDGTENLHPCNLRIGYLWLLLTFYSNHGPILYCFQDIARCWPKLRIFLNPRLFNVPAEGFPWNYITALGFKN